ncbi:MAG: hypothetical protein HKM93_08030 [Desulfobacteraceae bacterium]|nr:hypothetical protein [Desulfobacteraceae bacterium]
MEKKSESLTDQLVAMIGNISDDQKRHLLAMLEQWQQKESRDGTRVHCLVPVDFSTDERVYRDFIHNFSEGGVFIESKEPFRVGQPISLSFSIPHTGKTVTIDAKIIRKEAEGIAAKFSEQLDESQQSIINRVVNT